MGHEREGGREGEREGGRGGGRERIREGGEVSGPTVFSSLQCSLLPLSVSSPSPSVTLVCPQVGKYTGLRDSYLSIEKVLSPPFLPPLLPPSLFPSHSDFSLPFPLFSPAFTPSPLPPSPSPSGPPARRHRHSPAPPSSLPRLLLPLPPGLPPGRGFPCPACAWRLRDPRPRRQGRPPSSLLSLPPSSLPFPRSSLSSTALVSWSFLSSSIPNVSLYGLLAGGGDPVGEGI